MKAVQKLVLNCCLFMLLWPGVFGVPAVLGQGRSPTPVPSASPTSTNFRQTYPRSNPEARCKVCCGRDSTLCSRNHRNQFTKDMGDAAAYYDRCVSEEEDDTICDTIRSQEQDSLREILDYHLEGCSEGREVCNGACEEDAAYCTVVDGKPVFNLPAPSPTATPSAT